ncbi:hypothetical protein NP233_g8413 [Leucocoprinus birnbaumii]|uniref:Uncharacterized protein n=1 Tax=Leucocoprinus birnbaumii TaxID=56174 RepID=A0AAD5VN53_9AGAR|nr:hypothetical protein NP233_g8413 [Leucocoprinus birnbaumii]
MVQGLETVDLTHLGWEDLTPRPLPASLELDQCKRLAFALVVLLELRKQKIAWGGGYPDAYEQWTEEEARARSVEILEEKLSELWENFLAQYHGPRDLHDVLWTPFFYEPRKLRTIRVVDFLADRDAPSKFVAHPIVSMTMSRAWKYGRPENNQPQSLLRRATNTDATPSKTHFLELLFDLGFLVLLLSYVIRPPNWPSSEAFGSDPTSANSYSAREGSGVILSAFVLLAFVSSPSALPLPGSLYFKILLWVIFFRFFMYHIPTVLPSPILLVRHQHSFPFATFLTKGLTRIARPLSYFYLPIALVTTFALSLSLTGPLTGPLGYTRNLQAILSPPGPDLPIIGAAPMDTRVVFLIMSVTVWLLVISSAYIIGSSTPVACTRLAITSSSAPWDVYTPEIGVVARIASYRAITAYATDYPFPPPLNLIELFFITIPVAFIRLSRDPRFKRAAIARLVWNVTVRPLMMVTTTLCFFLT